MSLCLNQIKAEKMKQNEALRNPRVIVVQKLYAQELNKKSELTFPKHRYKKFIILFNRIWYYNKKIRDSWLEYIRYI